MAAAGEQEILWAAWSDHEKKDIYASVDSSEASTFYQDVESRRDKKRVLRQSDLHVHTQMLGWPEASGLTQAKNASPERLCESGS